MKISRKIILLLSFILPLLARPVVSVSIEPLAYFVKQIAGKEVDINILIPKNSDEHHLDIKPKNMKELENSLLYFTLGLEFEESLLKTLRQNYPNIQLVDLSKGVKKLPLGQGLDPHIWLDPMIAKKMAFSITLALAENFPSHAALFKKNYKAFAFDMDAVDARVSESLSLMPKPYFISFHPSWGYFAKRYDLVQVAVEKDGKEPKLKDLLALASFIKKEGIKIVFIQDGFDTKALETLKQECDIKVVKLNHLEYNYNKMLINAAQKIAHSYQ